VEEPSNGGGITGGPADLATGQQFDVKVSLAVLRFLSSRSSRKTIVVLNDNGTRFGFFDLLPLRGLDLILVASPRLSFGLGLRGAVAVTVATKG
jgi:hypothetical protein